VERRTPWNAVPKMAVAPANLVTKATDVRKARKLRHMEMNLFNLVFSASAVSRLLASLSKRKEITLQENLTLRRLKLANHLFELK